MEIPFKRLSPEALHGLIEEFVTREGTDYGHTVVPVEQKMERVRRQIEFGRAVIVFDEESGTCNIVLKEELTAHKRKTTQE